MLLPERKAEIRMRHSTNQSITYVVLRQLTETWVRQHLQKAAASSLISFPRELEDEDDEP